VPVACNLTPLSTDHCVLHLGQVSSGIDYRHYFGLFGGCKRGNHTVFTAHAAGLRKLRQLQEAVHPQRIAFKGEARPPSGTVVRGQ
jgi:hypothetical protein